MADFYVSYQINAYAKDANLKAVIYSQLHSNTLDSSNEDGSEILQPHFRDAKGRKMVSTPAD